VQLCLFDAAASPINEVIMLTAPAATLAGHDPCCNQHAGTCSQPSLIAVCTCLAMQVPMHNQGGVWTALVAKLPKKGILYAYRVDGPGGWETGYR
jgi:hypothetical protein